MKKTLLLSAWSGQARLAALLSATASFALMAGTDPGANYPAAVLNDGPLAYYRFNDSTSRPSVNVNQGSLGSLGNATNVSTHLIPGAIVGSHNAATYFDTTAFTTVPWNAAVNPSASNSFTIEGWFYPTSDKVANGFYGPAPINNRYSYSGVNRQGWVYFQRNPDDTYSSDGQSDVGWNFRMYNGNGSSVGIEVTSGVPYRLGEWQQVVTVWDGPSQTLSMYINGQLAVSNTATAPGSYQPNTNDHDPAEAVNGPAGMTVGSYNNTQPLSNPYRGGVDEVAFYGAKLSDAQILAHYQNGTNAARALPYDQLIMSDAPVVYLRLDDAAPGPDIALNIGDLQNVGEGAHSSDVRHPVAGHAATAADAATSYHWRNGNATTSIPFAAENNPAATEPLTVEAWFRPTSDRINPGASPINNRLANGAANRTGWVFFQRAPNDTYSTESGYEGVGWNFRAYQGNGGNSSDITSYVPYTVGQWQHVVVTVDGANTTATMYINGVAAATNSSFTFAENVNPPLPPDDTRDPVDLTVGAYNKASGLGSNPFEGDVADVAIYHGLLTPDQILAHYQVGTNINRGTNYETLVLTSLYDGASTQGLQPATFLRLNEPAYFAAPNSGTLGDAATGVRVDALSNVAGPKTAGLEAANTAAALDGNLGWVSLDNPAGLNFSNQITLEAWVQSAATPAGFSRIISHGLPTLTSYGDPNDANAPATNGSVFTGAEVFLAIDSNGNYSVGSSLDGLTFHQATAPVPAGDVGSWVHLAGTYDGANWNLFHNGTLLASAADAVGAVTVDNAGWAIGSTGNGWADNFNGAIDEVAVYNYALSPAQVAAHYVGQSLPLTLTTPTVGANGVTLSWTGGHGPFLVQYKSALTGPWLDLVTTPTTSVTLPSVLSDSFYRVISGTTNSVQLFKAALAPAHEVPAVANSTAIGSGFLSLEGNIATYYVYVTGLSADILQAHLHGAAPVTASAGVYFHLFPSPNIPTGTRAILFHGSQALTPAQLTAVTSGLTYFNVHTTAHPGGEMRGQVLP